MSWSDVWSSFADGMVPLLALWGLQASVLLIGALLLTTMWRRAPAAARHFIWAVALGGALLLPVATLLPWRASLPIDVPDVVSMQSPAVTHAPATASVEAGAAIDVSAADAPARALDWSVVIATIWLLGALLLLARLELNELVMRVIRARSEVVDDPAWQRARDHAAQRVGARAGVALLRTRNLQIPLATGYRRPAVLLPAGATEWSEELRELVLLHELAHIARRDLHVQTLGQLVKAIYWFNPLVWWACARLRAEAERACDDRVLNAGVRASSYAASLLALVHAHRAPRLVAALPMAQKAGFEGRVLAILDAHRNRGRARRAHVVITVAACGALLIALSALRPARAEAILRAPHLDAPAVLPEPVIQPVLPEASTTAPLQQSATISLAQSPGDSARLVRRRAVSSASFAITSKDGVAALLLTDDAVVLQLTDRWIDSVATQTAPGEENDFAKRLLQNLIRTGITTLLDHAVAYPLSGIGSATYENNELLLLNRWGVRLFNNTRINAGEVMRSFSSRDAQAFATRVNRAIYGGSIRPRSLTFFALRGEHADNIVSGKVDVMVEAIADPADNVQRVEVRVDDVPVCFHFTHVLRAARITCTLNTAETDAAGRPRFANGPHRLSAVGLDTSGEVVLSTEYGAQLRFDNAARNTATITIDSIAPLEAGNVVRGGVTLYAALNAEVGDDVRRMEMRVDDVPVCIQTFSRPLGSAQSVATIYHAVRGSCPWNTADVDAEGNRRYRDGPHMLTVVALNNRGEVVARASRTLVVRNGRS